MAALLALGMAACAGEAPTTPDWDDPSLPLPEEPEVFCLEVSPAPLDLGARELGCPLRRPFTVTNVCADALVVRSIGLSSPSGDFIIVQAPAVPSAGLLVGPGGKLHLAVRFAPTVAGPSTGALGIELAAKSGSATARWDLSGTGLPMSVVTDSFMGDETRPRNDVLLVIDNGPLLAPHLDSLRKNLREFAAYFSSSELGRFAVTTTGGAGPAQRAELIPSLARGAVLDPSLPGFVAAAGEIVDALVVRPGGEDPLQVALETLEQAQPGGPYAELFSGAEGTRVIVFTAGPDRSPDSAMHYLEWLRFLATGTTDRNRGRFVLDAIACFADGQFTSCARELDNGVLRFLVDRTNGVRDEIDSPDWWKSLEPLSKGLGHGQYWFPLTAVPGFNRGELAVRLGGNLVPAIDPHRGDTIWAWDPVGNAVAFELVYSPGPGQHLTVTYPLQCAP